MELSNDQIADQIGQVADTIERRGWKHGEGWVSDIVFTRHEDGSIGRKDITRTEGPVCLEGAVEAVTGLHHYQSNFPTCPLATAIRTYLMENSTLAERSAWFSLSQGLWGWNDQAKNLAPEGIDPKDYVIDTLRLAEKHYRSQA